MVKQEVINTCLDGTCRTLVAWYAKGGRSNFCAWNGPDRFLMTAVLEEIDVEPEKQEIWKFQGYGNDDPREGGHFIKFQDGDGDISPTLTTLSSMGLAVIEEYEV